MSSGIAGNKNFLELKTPIIEGMPKIKMVLKSTNFCFILEITPAILLSPTMAKEYVVASKGDTWKKYTNRGTVNIEPPLPIRPNEMPISIDTKYPISSMYLIFSKTPKKDLQFRYLLSLSKN
jgi:hypothetical protein